MRVLHGPTTDTTHAYYVQQKEIFSMSSQNLCRFSLQRSLNSSPHKTHNFFDQSKLYLSHTRSVKYLTMAEYVKFTSEDVEIHNHQAGAWAQVIQEEYDRTRVMEATSYERCVAQTHKNDRILMRGNDVRDELHTSNIRLEEALEDEIVARAEDDDVDDVQRELRRQLIASQVERDLTKTFLAETKEIVEERADESMGVRVRLESCRRKLKRGQKMLQDSFDRNEEAIEDTSSALRKRDYAAVYAETAVVTAARLIPAVKILYGFTEARGLTHEGDGRRRNISNEVDASAMALLKAAKEPSEALPNAEEFHWLNHRQLYFENSLRGNHNNPSVLLACKWLVKKGLAESRPNKNSSRTDQWEYCASILFLEQAGLCKQLVDTGASSLALDAIADDDAIADV
jgi:hypothetical protein